jgi:GTP cyclohydrolase II
MKIEHVGEADFPTEFGDFRIHAFRDSKGGEHLVLLRRWKRGPVLLRIHSKCTTGDIFHSLRCDCRKQLENSLKRIAEEGGLLLYMDQEGRGIGLSNKIIAYHLQDNGKDTVEANLELGFSEDERTYETAAGMLKYFGINEVKMLTNNPEKIKELEKNGIRVTRIPLRIKPTDHNRKYLDSKKNKLGHAL